MTPMIALDIVSIALGFLTTGFVAGVFVGRRQGRSSAKVSPRAD